VGGVPSEYCLDDGGEGCNADFTSIQAWIDRSVGDVASQGNQSFQPLWRNDAGERWVEAGTNHRLEADTALTCSGAFHVFWRGVRPSAAKLMIWANDGPINPAVCWWNDDSVYVIRDDGGTANNAVPPVSGLHWLHVWRDQADAVRAQAQGGSVVFLGTLSGVITLKLLFGRPNSNQWTEPTVKTLVIAAHNTALSAGQVTTITTALEAITLNY
jgi:hypothetical protein